MTYLDELMEAEQAYHRECDEHDKTRAELDAAHQLIEELEKALAEQDTIETFGYLSWH